LGWLGLTLAAACAVEPGAGTVAAQEPSAGTATAKEALRERSDPFVQPAGTVAVNFRVDDRANRVYRQGDLLWKGSFLLNPATRILSSDTSWSGAAPGEPPRSGWPVLYDDGPWTRGGHEPEGARRGDHVWGVTVFVAVPAESPLDFQYGLTDESYEAALGNGWVWRKGPNGSFSVWPGQTGSIDAEGMAFPRFGHADLRIELDTRVLSQPWQGWDTSSASVKSGHWGWGLFPMEPIDAGRYALELGRLLRTGLLPHSGLLWPNEQPEFVLNIGGLDYAGWVEEAGQWQALTGGVSASYRCGRSGAFTPLPLEIEPRSGNTQVTAPACPDDDESGDD
jgi:hypothetical protein